MLNQGNIGVAAIKAVNGEKFVIGASSDLLCKFNVKKKIFFQIIHH
jgi:hypothetical protein